MGMGLMGMEMGHIYLHYLSVFRLEQTTRGTSLFSAMGGWGESILKMLSLKGPSWLRDYTHSAGAPSISGVLDSF